ncbi:hypothetical protein LCY76_23680 [Fictibacillus sp. KIGAM418]|uniref:Uncharacterized protein n=1 Tax=Fictibacillus marinisediminis TaxID=2878389 RepID=A0A9X2BJE2_9BACL|nr:hypothetical protein [Fictibacillus marinisediminis]MCK6259573.1 hypothetical protein [Fictibacillus marinisediminis]
MLAVTTEDTKRILQEGEGAYLITFAGEWYKKWFNLAKDCMRSGMSKEEFREAMDPESETASIFYTTFSEQEASVAIFLKRRV